MTARPLHPAVAVLLSAAACLGALFALAPRPASAHPYLVQTVPGPGVILRDPPATIQIGFTEAVILGGSSLRLEDGERHPLRLGPLREPKEGPGLAADVEEALGGEVYRVRWVVLGNDGHTASGAFSFGVNGPNGRPPAGAEALSATGGPADQVPAADGPLRVGLRWIGLLGASLLVGGAALVTRLRGRLDPAVEAVVAHRWARLARLGWALTLAGAVAALVAAANAGVGEARLAIVLATSTGVVALARLAGVVLAGLPGLRSAPGPRQDQFLGVAGGFFLGAEAVGGHITALTDFRLPAILAQAAHLAAAGIWVGGLVVLAYAMAGVPAPVRHPAWRTAASAYRPVATVSAVVVIATGVVASLREVQHSYFLFWSAYGRFLLAKWVLVAAMLVAGAVAGRALVGARRSGVPGSGVSPAKTEAVLGVAVLVFAATLVGVAQGRGQPLPAQRGSVLAGPAFANAVVGGGLARLVLAPAAPGGNRLTVHMGSPVEATVAGVPAARGASEAPGRDPRAIEVSLSCACAPKSKPVKVLLTPGAGVWRADVDLPASGVWRTSLFVDGRASLAPVALRVSGGGAPGAPPVVIASVADLSGPGARRCRSFQLGMVLSLALLNAGGGVGGRKVVLRAADDGGDPARARKLAAAAAREAHLAAPCGAGGGATAEVLGQDIPVVMADAQSPPAAGPHIFRLAGDPYAEGWAVGRTLARTSFVGRPDVARRVSVLVDAGDPSAEPAIAGLRAALALDPAEAEKAEAGPKPASTAGVEVQVFRHEPTAPLPPMVSQAVSRDRYAAAFLRADPVLLGAALDQLTDEEIAGATGILVPPRAFDEAFYRSSKIGRRGDVKVLGEVAPDAADSFPYTRLVFAIFPGEQPSIDGLRGFMAGKAIVAGLAGGASPDEVGRRLQLLGLFSDGVVSGWSPAAPAAGSWRFFLYKGTFIPGGLMPSAKPEPGRFFPEGGAWSRVATGNVGLCGPQRTVGGPPPACTARPEPAGPKADAK